MEAHCRGISGLGVASGKDELDEGKDEGGAGTLAYEDNRGGWDRKMVRNSGVGKGGRDRLGGRRSGPKERDFAGLGGSRWCNSEIRFARRV